MAAVRASAGAGATHAQRRSTRRRRAEPRAQARARRRLFRACRATRAAARERCISISPRRLSSWALRRRRTGLRILPSRAILTYWRAHSALAQLNVRPPRAITCRASRHCSASQRACRLTANCTCATRWRRNSKTSAATPRRSTSCCGARRASGLARLRLLAGPECCSRPRRVCLRTTSLRRQIQSMRPRRRFSSSACRAPARRWSRRILASHPRVGVRRRVTEFRRPDQACGGHPGTPRARCRDARARDVADLADAIGRHTSPQTRPDSPKPRFVDKMPLNFFYLGALARALAAGTLRRAAARSARHVPQ